ncbi:catalase family protein [Novosphingobium lentum]|uniref:catalase family protein n=1 Tax=Novosphingobium lentum TaxID=145287 RepID=UPI00082D3D87|nr:catalase family protein [Novosphingobium lentum]
MLEPLHRLLQATLKTERRIDPFFRPAIDSVVRWPLTRLMNWTINLTRSRDVPPLAGERFRPDEDESLDTMVAEMQRQLDIDFTPGNYERAGNTKTHGLVRSTLTVRDDLPEHLRHGIFATQRSYPAWVRFSNPGPHVEPDIDDVGFGSIGIKLMDVPGAKLMDDEHFTQDFTAVSTVTFVTPDTRENARLQYWSRRHLPIWYFLSLRHPHVRDFIMQALWNRTLANPLANEYFSCVPYLIGEGQAMQYSFHPLTPVSTRIPNLPRRPPDNYIRDNLAASLRAGDAQFEMRVILQTDPFLMPIEQNSVLWDPRLSPRIPVATLTIPKQEFQSPAQFAFARQLTLNPWHCLPEHRPLGNQSRARKRMYYEMSRYRQARNGETHVEPTGDERFD